MTGPARVPAGAPAGGQFAASPRPESRTGLTDGGLVSAAHALGGKVDLYASERDGALVVDVDTADLEVGRQVRVAVNDGYVCSGDPERDGVLDPERSRALVALVSGPLRDRLAGDRSNDWSAVLAELDRILDGQVGVGEV